MLYFMLFVAFAILTIASYTDLKYKEVPDWLNYSGIVIGVMFRLIYSVHESSWNYVFEGVFGFVLMGAFGTVMFYLGQWGGGDAKMFMALGSLLGFKLSIHDNYLIYFIMNLIVASFFYTSIFLVGLTARNFNNVLEEFSSVKKYGLFLLLRNISLGVLSLGILGLFVLVVPAYFMTVFVFLAVIPVVLVYVGGFVKAIEIACLERYVAPHVLTEGDWVIEDVELDGELICSQKDLGVTKEQIQRLCHLYEKGKIKSVRLKTGIPFVPSFLLAMIFAVVFKNPFVYFL